MTAEDSLLKEIEELANSESGRGEAREKCFSFLSENPSSPKVRVVLSKLFYLDSYNEFAIRELQELRRQYKNPLIDRVLKELGVGVSAKGHGDKVIAEVKS